MGLACTHLGLDYLLLLYSMWVCANIELAQSRWNGEPVIVQITFLETLMRIIFMIRQEREQLQSQEKSLMIYESVNRVCFAWRIISKYIIFKQRVWIFLITYRVIIPERVWLIRFPVPVLAIFCNILQISLDLKLHKVSQAGLTHTCL